jgi:DNA (cytosine-5)-methyltransferase 1
MSKKPVTISLYTGAGGLDYGFEAVGFRTAVAVEFDDVCVKTLKRNRPSWPVIQDDINRVPTNTILRRAKLGHSNSTA